MTTKLETLQLALQTALGEGAAISAALGEVTVVVKGDHKHHFRAVLLILTNIVPNFLDSIVKLKGEVEKRKKIG